ncbi:unnamed protein product [Peniophora sp. CBMAI 1063]|nr:unnamed protein product [Peniophora sp. CBMAI 1063]
MDLNARAVNYASHPDLKDVFLTNAGLSDLDPAAALRKSDGHKAVTWMDGAGWVVGYRECQAGCLVRYNPANTGDENPPLQYSGSLDTSGTLGLVERILAPDQKTAKIRRFISGQALKRALDERESGIISGQATATAMHLLNITRDTHLLTNLTDIVGADEIKFVLAQEDIPLGLRFNARIRWYPDGLVQTDIRPF